jgi:hypothetical protein
VISFPASSCCSQQAVYNDPDVNVVFEPQEKLVGCSAASGVGAAGRGGAVAAVGVHAAGVCHRARAQHSGALLQNDRSNNTQQPRFVDLGSGDGTTIFAASSLFWKSVGVELNTTLWAISHSKHCTFIHGDMLTNIHLKDGIESIGLYSWYLG